MVCMPEFRSPLDGSPRPATGPRPARRHVLRGAGAGLLAAGWGTGLLGCLSACQAPQPPLRVGTIVFPGYELLFLARELGLLDEQLLRLVELRSNTDTLRALAIGQLEAATLTLDELLSARADGVDLRVALVMDQSDGADALLARAGIGQLRALKGLRIGVEDSANGALLLGAALERGQLRVDQVHKVPISLDRSVDAFRSGAVDAVVSAEPWATQLEQLGAERLFDSSAIPGRIVDVLAVQAPVFELQRAALQRLVAAHFSALALLRSAPARAHPLLAPRLQLAPDQVARAFRGMHLPDLAENRRLLGPSGQLLQSARSLMVVMQQQGLLAKPLDLQGLVDLRGLPEA